MTRSKSMFLGSLVVLMTTLHALGAFGDPDRSGNPPALPDEAYTACDGKSEGDECTITMRDEEVASTCRKSPDKEDSRLVCLPPRPEGGGRPDGPPPDDR